MSKRSVEVPEWDTLNEQMRSLRKKFKKFKKASEEKGRQPAASMVEQTTSEVKENDVAVVEEIPEEVSIERDSEAESGERLDSSSASSGGSDTEGSMMEKSGKEEEPSLSNDMRKTLCLKATPDKSADIKLHPVLVAEWTNWMHAGLYDGDEEDEKKREEEEGKAREEIMKKFPRKEELQAEAPKLNPEILAYMSGTAKNRDKHFVASQNALGSAMIAVAKSISLILELEEGEITSTLLQFLGNAGKLMAGIHYQQSLRRRAFILPGIDEKYRELLRKSEITDDLFGKDLFKRLKHTKSLGKVVEELGS